MIIVKYITARQLINAHDQSYVNVTQDVILLETVAGGGESYEFLKREEVVQRVSEKMQSWYEISVEGKEPILKCVLSVARTSVYLTRHTVRFFFRKGQLKPVSIVVKALKQGRRASTSISGFEPFFVDSETMAEELRRICSGSTSGMSCLSPF